MTFPCSVAFGRGYVALIVSDPSKAPQVGETFETSVDLSTKDVALGAYLMTVNYDPLKLRILQIGKMKN